MYIMNSEIKASRKRLSDGNQRFISGLRSVDSLASHARLKELAEKGQKPFASVLACADSRGPAELVFDCGVGDLFVCRIAGNVANNNVIASLEYAAMKLGTPLIVVMGHSLCGAVEAALGDLDKLPSAHLKDLVSRIAPARTQLSGGSPQELVRQASRRNVDVQRHEILKQSEILRGLHEAGKIAVVGAFFDISSGRVEFIEETAAVEVN